MPRLMDPVLAQALERANPDVCEIVRVNAPDVGLVLHRAVDQFLNTPPLVAETPANTLNADPAGALTLNDGAGTNLIAAMTRGGAHAFLKATALQNTGFFAFAWVVDPAFGSGVMKSFTARIGRRVTTFTNDVALQIYRRRAVGGVVNIPGTGDTIPLSTFEPVLSNPIVWKNTAGAWSGSGDSSLPQVADALFSFDDQHIDVGVSNVPPITGAAQGEENVYYFSLEPVNGTADDFLGWYLDSTTTRVVANVGTFEARSFFVPTGAPDNTWQQDTTTFANVVPTATLTIRSYDATSQAVYAIDLGAVPQHDSIGRIVFERSAPTGTTATLALSTSGSGGPFTSVTDDDVLAIAQQLYHLQLTLQASGDGRRAPGVTAMGVQFVIPIDVTNEAIVDPIEQQIAVPFLAAGIGEGSVTVVRTGRRDYRDTASDLATTYAASKLELEISLGSLNPAVTSDKWMLIDRALVNDRSPSAESEQFNLLSYLKVLKQKIPQRMESTAVVCTVTSATSTSVTVAEALPNVTDPDTGEVGNAAGFYDGLEYFLRVRSSSQHGVANGFLATIDNNSGPHTVTFDNPLPGTLIAGDQIEIHSGRYDQVALSWSDADPCDVWWDLLTNHCAIPPERIGIANLGTASRSGLPPRVSDRAPGDAATQSKLLVTLGITKQEEAKDLIDQLSFIMGGATIEVAGQIVFRQIYPLRDPSGAIVVAPPTIAATFDVRQTTGLSTPVALQQRMPTLACDYGLNTTEVTSNTLPALTSVFNDVDAIAWLDEQDVDDLASAAIDATIARWCYNSADAGLYLAGYLTGQVVRAASTGLRVWAWNSTERMPQLVVGDRVVMITDQYTDYDPARKLAIRGWFAYTLVIVSVQGGGTSFRGFMLGLNDAVQLKGGPGNLATIPDDDDTTAGEILAVHPQESADGATRDYTLTCGSAVDRVFVHFRLWPITASGNAFDFTTSQFVGDAPDALIVAADPTDGLFRFAMDHPANGFVVYIAMVPRLGAPEFTLGTQQWNDVLEPAPSHLAAKITPTITNATAAVSIALTIGPSDSPVEVDVFTGSVDASPLVQATITDNETLDATLYPQLGAIALPAGKESLLLRVRMTNVAGTDAWFELPLNRDPLPGGTVTVDNYQPAPVFLLAPDPDVDDARYTASDGRMRNWDRAQLDAIGGAFTFTVSEDTFDDDSTETALAVDENRAGAKVEFRGGGTWVLMWGSGDDPDKGVLHGEPSQPPGAEILTDINADRDAESVTVIPSTSVNEKLLIFFRLGDTELAPVYELCVSAGDDTPLAVEAGTTVNSANFFQNIDGTGSPSAKLANIGLTRDQVKRYGVMIKGAESGVESPWLPVVLSLMEKPWLTSLSGEWDQATLALRARIKGGAHCAGVFVEAANTSNFASPLTAQHVCNDGDDVLVSFTLSGAQCGQTWYLRATPWNGWTGTAVSGLDGVGDTAEVAVPALYDLSAQSVNDPANHQATLALTVNDPASVLHPTNKIKFFVDTDGVTTLTAPTSAPGGSTTTGVYSITVGVKRETKVEPQIFFADGSNLILGAWVFTGDVAPANGTISIDPISGNLSAQANASMAVDLPNNAASARYAFAAGTAPSQPVDSTVAGSGTIINGRNFSVANFVTLNLADAVLVTIIPFTGINATGTPLPSIHLRATFSTFAKLKVVTYSKSNWKENSVTTFGLAWTSGDFSPTNPSIPAFGVMDLWLEGIVPAGSKLHEVDFALEWDTAATRLSSFGVAALANGTGLNSAFATYAGGAQTISLTLADTVVSTTQPVVFHAIWFASASAATAGQAIVRNPTLTYISPSTDVTV